MLNTKELLLAFVACTSLGGCASTSHVLIGQDFIGEERSLKLMMSQPKGDSDDKVVDQYMRVCTIKGSKETNCKDTLVLSDVHPGSLY